MIITNPKLNYGMHVFYGTATDDVVEAIKKGFNFCGINQDDVLACGQPANNGAALHGSAGAPGRETSTTTSRPSSIP